MKEHLDFESNDSLGALSRLFVSGVVTVSWEYYKNTATPYEQLFLNFVANERFKYINKIMGGE